MVMRKLGSESKSCCEDDVDVDEAGGRGEVGVEGGVNTAPPS